MICILVIKWYKMIVSIIMENSRNSLMTNNKWPLSSTNHLLSKLASYPLRVQSSTSIKSTISRFLEVCLVLYNAKCVSVFKQIDNKAITTDWFDEYDLINWIPKYLKIIFIYLLFFEKLVYHYYQKTISFTINFFWQWK